MRILLIDDSSAYGDEFNLLLADAGIIDATVDFVLNASDGALSMVSSLHDIYFVDYHLPGDNGLTLIAEARSIGVTKPIIMLTGFSDPQIDYAAEQAGASDYLRKGEFSPQLLGRAIRYALRNAAAVQTAKEAASRLRMAQEAGKVGVWDWDMRTNAVVWSSRQYEIFGLDPAAVGPVRSDQWHLAAYPADRDAASAAMTAAIAGHVPYDTMFRILRHDLASETAAASVRWISAKGEIERDPSGLPIRMTGVSIDVTDQQNVLATLRDSRNLSESRFRTYFDNAAECLFYVHIAPDGRFLYEAVNPAALAHAGLTLKMMCGRSPGEVLSREEGNVTVKALQHVCDSGKPYLYEPTFTTTSGTVTYDVVYMPVRNKAGKIVGVLCTARDISERRRLEAVLRQAQKMETLGQLAAGVAHDFNNVLQGVLGSLELILDDAVAGSELRESAEIAFKSAQRGAGLTNQLLSFARKQMLMPQTIDVPAFLGDLRKLLARTLGPHISVTVTASASMPKVFVDPDQLQAALLNLAINAGHAMASGGTLRLDAFVELAPSGGQSWLVIAVCDTGSGMSPETLARAAEPFFTTKGISGTGLGVSMVQGFAGQSGGELRLSSVPGQGSRAEIVLPAQKLVSLPVTPTAAPTVQRPGRVLLVDDSPDVLHSTSKSLRQAGFTVTTAVSGDDALALLARGSRFDALVTDYAMPGLSGVDLVALVREMQPNLPAIVITGFAEVDTTRIAEVGLVLRKPFQRQQLVTAISSLIASPVATCDLW